MAESLLANNPSDPEAKRVPAAPDRDEPGAPSLSQIVAELALHAGLEIDVRISPRLVSNAAAGDRTVFIAKRRFGAREARRLAVHEVLGHLVAAFNGRTQPLGIFALGTAGSFGDQEGMCIALEEVTGLLDADRVRMLAARVLVTDWVHEGASFAEAANALVDDYGFPPFDAIVLAERGYRGGGVARDIVYLRGWMRVRGALESGAATLDSLRLGKVGVDDQARLQELAAQGWVDLSPPYRPSFSRSAAATGPGTSFVMSPPNLETSFTRPDAT